MATEPFDLKLAEWGYKLDGYIGEIKEAKYVLYLQDAVAWYEPKATTLWKDLGWEKYYLRDLDDVKSTLTSRLGYYSNVKIFTTSQDGGSEDITTTIHNGEKDLKLLSSIRVFSDEEIAEYAAIQYLNAATAARLAHT